MATRVLGAAGLLGDRGSGGLDGCRRSSHLPVDQRGSLDRLVPDLERSLRPAASPRRGGPGRPTRGWRAVGRSRRCRRSPTGTMIPTPGRWRPPSSPGRLRGGGRPRRGRGRRSGPGHPARAAAYTVSLRRSGQEARCPRAPTGSPSWASTTSTSFSKAAPEETAFSRRALASARSVGDAAHQQHLLAQPVGDLGEVGRSFAVSTATDSAISLALPMASPSGWLMSVSRAVTGVPRTAPMPTMVSASVGGAGRGPS